MSACIYLIENAGRFIIGMADDVQQQIKALQASQANQAEATECRLLCAVRLEKPALVLASLHQQYESKHLLDTPETVAVHWFTLTQQEAEELSCCLLRIFFEERRQIHLRQASSERVLLAWKAKTLGFEPPPGFVWEGVRVDTDQGHQNYAVEFDPAFSPQAKATVHYWKQDGQPDSERAQTEHEGRVPGYWYQSVAEAKAACQIHAATGNFPPSVKPVLLTPAELL